MRVVFIASGDFAIPTLRALLASSHDIACVVTQPDRPAGRGRRVVSTPVKRFAAEAGLDVLASDNVNAPGFIDDVQRRGATLGLVIAFGQKLGEPFRSAFSGGCVNLHASLLPLYRGAAPYQWAIIRGESETGVTVFKLVDRMDAGPVLTRVRTAIGESETAEMLHDRLANLGPEAVFDALAMYADGEVPPGIPQDDSEATSAPKFTKADGELSFDAPAEQLVREINGLWSWPGARCRFVAADGTRDESVTLAQARLVPATQGMTSPGSVTSERHVAATGGAVEIIQIKPKGGRRMSWQAFSNGRHVAPGDRFCSITD